MSAGGNPRGARRRLVVASLAAGALSAAGAGAQTRAGPRSIGVLWPGVRTPNTPAARGFRDRLRDLGHVEGRTIAIHERHADGRLELLPELARALVEVGVEIIVAVGGSATAAASRTTRTIPIVMVDAASPIEAGWIKSLARPGGNVTGTTSMLSDLTGKHVELLRQLVPAARRIAMVANPEGPGVRGLIVDAREAGRTLGVEVLPFDVVRTEDVAPTLARVAGARPDAMLVFLDAVLILNRAQVIDFAARAGLPALYTWGGLAREGGLMSYAPETKAYFLRAADYVDRILRGANPADLPVEQPTVFELAVNLRAARALGLEIPPTILSLADEVVE